ncbi:hypothetical protein CVD19_13505 [Bacillus sp. T33-2]|nr:hypothetical protein [Bacillus sp. T33-2]PLR95747.1 hypothetical protein CVD19_13505 [Bacillus sp. T33-2]
MNEPFGEKAGVWIGKTPSDGKRIRLNTLLNMLNLKEEDTLQVRYQLLHRTASAIIEAKKVNAKNALMLVLPFNQEGKWFEDYASFVELFNLTRLKGAVVGPFLVSGGNLYFGWVTCNKVLPKEVFL